MSEDTAVAEGHANESTGCWGGAAEPAQPPVDPPQQGASEAAAQPDDDVAFLLRVFKVEDLGLRRDDGSVKREVLASMLQRSGHLIATRIAHAG